ncbi:maltokinase N-terminal cap-like domain-containing protein [Propioniciclava soli]|uniref:Maltokinase N-terminal cap domain-containing protein n=1 Tax=Propioniciclava soli TaxID=2775081 RepID=A0ABZ3C4D8_9ACTN|nr:hypothetical protein [Propioniciclava soli]
MSGTAEVHPNATLTPSKLELLAGWLPKQLWFAGDASDVERIGFFRFVDPDGEVGIDCMVITSAGFTYHVPVTWRSEPLDEGLLIGTLEHSVLGTRYCYDAPTDPVYVAELVRIIREGDAAADIADADSGAAIPSPIEVEGSGVVAGVDAIGQVRLVRILDEEPTTTGARGLLLAHWSRDGADREDVLAVLR